MEHLIAKATTVETEEEMGVFEAIVSAWTEDRQQDEILPTAFDKTIAAWKESGRWLPLLFEHSVKAVGEIDPESMRTNAEGLVVRGHVDQSSDEGEQVWRMIKANTASFSIGGLLQTRRRKGGGRIITEVDLLEISATATPANPRARTLSWKSEAMTETGSFGERRYLIPGPYGGLEPVTREESLPYFETLCAELEEKEAAEAMRQRCSVPPIPTKLIFYGNRCVEVDGRDPDDISPGFTRNGRALPSPNELRRAKEKAERERREFKEKWAAREAEGEALSRVRENYEKEALTPIAGLRVHPANINIRTNGQ